MNFPKTRGEGDGLPRVKLKDKESIKGVLRGDPKIFYQHWIGSVSHPCPGRQTCSHCAQGVRSAFRFKLNFITKEGDQYVAKILEQGSKLYDQLEAINTDWPLEKSVIKVTRNGSGQNDTTYLATPVQALTEVQLKQIAAVPLHNLDEIPESDAKRDEILNPEKPHEEDIPF
jgi:hypothetical protein